MTTKTTHRIPADKVVIEDGRRVKPGKLWGRRNSYPKHNYSQPHKIIYIPVEPHLMQVDTPAQWHEVLINQFSPFHPDDTLILLEEWCCWIKVPSRERIYLLKRTANEHDLKNADWHTPFGMPPELDSQCQQYNVVKVLGVEEREGEVETTRDGEFYFELNKIWHWKLLTREQLLRDRKMIRSDQE